VYSRLCDLVVCRWIEYSASASLMALALCATCGIREQNTLALVFICSWVTCILGLFNELYSRPVVAQDTTSYGWAKGSKGITGVPDPTNDRTALHVISQLYWEVRASLLKLALFLLDSGQFP
jgi:hypothetical protein